MERADLFNIGEQVAIVTAAASGLGRAFDEVMAENGADVILVDKDGPALTDVSQELAGHGVRVTSEVVDIPDDAALRALFTRTVPERGRLDTVFANAGISAPPGRGGP